MSPWCDASADNCRGPCNGVWCPTSAATTAHTTTTTADAGPSSSSSSTFTTTTTNAGSSSTTTTTTTTNGASQDAVLAALAGLTSTVAALCEKVDSLQAQIDNLDCAAGPAATTTSNAAPTVVTTTQPNAPTLPIAPTTTTTAAPTTTTTAAATTTTTTTTTTAAPTTTTTTTGSPIELLNVASFTKAGDYTRSWTLTASNGGEWRYSDPLDAMDLRPGAAGEITTATLLVPGSQAFSSFRVAVTGSAKRLNDNEDECRFEASTDGGATWHSPPVLHMVKGQHLEAGVNSVDGSALVVALEEPSHAGNGLMVRYSVTADGDVWDAICYLRSVRVEGLNRVQSAGTLRKRV